MSGVFSPTPAQNSFMPPPVPVDSTTGVLNLPTLPKLSATAVVKGNTVEDPTMRIWSRAWAAPAVMARPATAASATEMRFIASPSMLGGAGQPQNPNGGPPRHAGSYPSGNLGRFRDS